VMEEEPVAKAWHNYFYPAENGTHFKAEYKFEVDNLPKGEAAAVIEVAENLDRITLNGKELKPLKEKGENKVFDPEKSWKDINFTKVPLQDSLKVGENVLTIKGRKENNITAPGCHIGVEDPENHNPTEVEAVYIIGDFSVKNIDNTKFIIDGEKEDISQGRNLNKEGYPFYAGKVEYSTFVNIENILKEDLWFKVNEVEAACIEIYINGEKIGNKYWKPYLFEVSDYIQEGENEIKITAATDLFNLTGPNWISGIKEDKGISPHSFIDFSRYTEKYSFFPFGIGGVSLIK